MRHAHVLNYEVQQNNLPNFEGEPIKKLVEIKQTTTWKALNKKKVE